ncbi:MAG: alpha/beta hydrolase [Sphingobacteriales bacterium]|nr:MAG: alpha/beta hydrolase [Sphingobacteriales bacterium]
MALATTTATAKTEGKYAKVNGINMYYEVCGEGKPLVLIHGAASTIQTTFGRVLPLFAQKHKVIAVELQIHGHTSDRNAPLSFEQDAEDVAELLKQLGIKNADVMGFSNGGTTTMYLAARHPDLVNKIVIASGMYKHNGVPDAFWEGMKTPKLSDMPQVYQDEYKRVAPKPELLDTMFIKCAQRMQTFKDMPAEDVAAIKAPSLIIIGDKDVPTPEHAVEMYHTLPHSSLIILPGFHGDYIGEIANLKNSNDQYKLVVPMIEHFLSAE